MSSPDNEGSNQDELANIWGSGWYKLTPKQRQLVEEIMNNFKIVKISEILEEKVYKMPFPSFVEVSDKTKAAFLFAQITPNNLTVSWQLILVEIINGLINQDYKKAFQLLFLELDYIQINRNAINDVCAVTQQSLNPNIAIKIEAKINSIKKWVSNYLHCPQDERANLNQLINEFSGLVNLLKDIEVVGIGAFVLAATLQLTIQQEKAKISSSEWSQVKNLAVEYIHYAKTVNPRLFRLSVGRIDKSCQCTKYTPKGEEITEYECRYFDGKDIHVFREHSNSVGHECNKHRLKKFHMVVEQVNQTVSHPVRTAIKKWQELAVRAEELEARG